MRKLLQKNGQSFQNAVIGRHDVEQQAISFIDGDFDPITGQIDFESLRLKGHGLHPDSKRLSESVWLLFTILSPILQSGQNVSIAPKTTFLLAISIRNSVKCPGKGMEFPS
jgi:hypothetical protein